MAEIVSTIEAGSYVLIPDKAYVCRPARVEKAFSPGQQAVLRMLRKEEEEETESKTITFDGTKSKTFMEMSGQVFDEKLDNLISLGSSCIWLIVFTSVTRPFLLRN